MQALQGIRKGLKTHVSDDFQRKRQQMIILLLVIGTISGGMAILNIATHKEVLLIATACFCVVSYIAAFIGHLDKKGMTWSSSIFGTEVILLFVFFIINGGTEGFSTIWLLLIPACGLFALGIKIGSLMSAAVLAALIFFFYTPIGRNLLQCTDYTDSFMMRFPIIYVAFWIIGLFLEVVRDETYNQLVESRQKYEYLSKHDELTGLLNRIGFNREMDRVIAGYEENKTFALMIADVDFFKDINDKYGHSVGDIVLHNMSQVLTEFFADKDAVACRWGGEEFAVLLSGESALDYINIAEELRAFIENTVLEEKHQIKNTISIGCASSDRLDEVDAAKIVIAADQMLYAVKESGRNQVKYI